VRHVRLPCREVDRGKRQDNPIWLAVSSRPAAAPMLPIEQGGGKRRGAIDEGTVALFAGKRQFKSNRGRVIRVCFARDALEGILNDIGLTLR
jgi:hypothetical protein